MKKIFVVFLLFSSTGTVLVAQENSKEKKQAPSQDRLIVDFVHDNWLNKPDSIKTKWFSHGVAVSLLYDYRLSKSNFSAAGGAGITCHNVHNNSKIFELPDTTGQFSSALIPYASDLKFKKNKLSTNYADAIAELRYRSKPNSRGHSWKFAVGGRYGMLLQAHDAFKDNTGKYKTYIFPNITKRRYGAHFRASYGRVGVFGFYSLTGLFQKDKGTEFTPFSVGISVMPM